jgi:hypothetical protein
MLTACASNPDKGTASCDVFATVEHRKENRSKDESLKVLLKLCSYAKVVREGTERGEANV